MRRLLLTGFEPFGGGSVNPSWEVARRLDGEEVGGYTVVARRLPVIWGQALNVLWAELDEVRPDLIISLGQSGGRAEICPERVGINVCDAASGDNAGTVLTDEPIVPAGPAAYFSTLPLKPMVQAMREAGVPARVSNSAGTYLCNQVLYGLLHRLAPAQNSAPAGFIHVPALPEQVSTSSKGEPSMDLATQVRGIRAAIGACA